LKKYQNSSNYILLAFAQTVHVDSNRKDRTKTEEVFIFTTGKTATDPDAANIFYK